MAITLVIFGMLFIIDQLTKYLTQLYIAPNTTVCAIPHVFSLTIEYNDGAGFSMLSDAGWLLVIVSFIATIVLAYFCSKNDWKREKYKSFLLTMIMAGCVGNLFDRIVMNIDGLQKARPGVVDMIDFIFLDFIWEKLFNSTFAICNVADVYLVVGLILFAIDLIFFADRRKKKYEAKSREAVWGYKTR